MLDELAEQLGLDRIEIRLRNAAKEGTRQPRGPLNRRIGNIECLEAARDSAHYQAPLWPSGAPPLPLWQGAARSRSPGAAPVAAPRPSHVGDSGWCRAPYPPAR